jgi:hypothetical protein
MSDEPSWPPVSSGAPYDGLAGQGWTSVISRSRSYSRGTSGFTNGNNFVTAFTQVMSCYLFTCVQACTQIKLAFGAYAYATDIGNQLPITHVAIEYPHNSGNFLDVLFGGAQGVTLNNGQTILSDPLPLSMAAGTVFNVRTYINGIPSASNWPVMDDAYTGDRLTASSGTTADGTHVAYSSLTNDKAAGYGPCGIFGNVQASSLAVVGDSISQSVNDTVNGPPAGVHAGWVDRAFSNSMGLVNICRHAERGDSFFSATVKHRRALAYSCSRALVEYGNNDFYTATNLTADQAANAIIPVWRELRARSMKVWGCTVTPRCTSSDAFATSANQTPVANGANRIAFNQWMRDGAPIDINSNMAPVGTASGVVRVGQTGHPLAAIYDIATVVETDVDSGKWKNVADNGTGPWTSDGTHPTALGHVAMAALITPSDFA